MALAIFDLDNTLIAGDSDYLWGRYLVARGILDDATYDSENERFYQQYLDGSLNIDEFLRFQLAPLARYPRTQLDQWRADFIATRIEPLLLSEAHALLDRHRVAGDRLMIITATNRFITEPIAALYGVDILLATEPASEKGEFTGDVEGIPCFQAGKVERLTAWLEAHGENLAGSHFYSDSHNDLPLLSRVEHPVAVDPDQRLRTHAAAHGWPIISLRG